MKKAISIALCLIMVISMFAVVPFSVSASDAEIMATGAISGTTGDCTWVLDNGVLTISGNGYMKYRGSPWDDNGPITSVIIEDGVKSISCDAFSGRTELESVTIGKSVEAIYTSAFNQCRSLKSVKLPNNLISIDSGAFEGCRSLTSVIVPDSVTYIGRYAFRDCSSLTDITIPDSVTFIGDYSVGYNGTTKVDNITICGYTGSTAETYANDNGFTFIPLEDNNDFEYTVNDAGNAVITGYTGTDTNITIPSEIDGYPVVGFGTTFRNNDSVVSIEVPNSVVSIDDYAFYYCTNLNSISIGDSVTAIGNNAFGGCSSLTEITIPDSVITVDSNAFQSCTSLESASIGNSVTTIGEYAFFNCSNLKSVIIGDSVTSVGRAAFFDCSNLENIIVGSSVSYFESSAFYGCSNLSEVHIHDLDAWCMINYGSEDSSPMYYAPNLYLDDELITDLVIPDTVTTIGSYAFWNCSGIEKLTITDSVTSIGESAFSGCSGISELTIGVLVENIGDSAFRDCTNIQEVTIPASVITIGNAAFSDCYNIIDLTIGSNVESIGDYAFSSCSNISEVIIPDSVITIGKGAFTYCGITDLTIGNSVESIDNNAFGDCWNIREVTIPYSVTYIGSYALGYTVAGKQNDFTIYGYSDTAAETYASDNGFDFVSLPTFQAHSLSLNGDIGVNFYLLLTQKEIDEGAIVNFSWMVDGKEKTDSVTLTSENKTTNGYRATCHIAPAEMTSEITATLTVGEEEVVTDTYSAQRYAQVILTDSDFRTKYITEKGQAKYNALVDLVHAMLDFGTRAQFKFNRDIDNPANGGTFTFTDPVDPDNITSTMSDMAANLSKYGLEYTGSTVVLLTETSIRHYYKIIDDDKFDAVKDNITFNGTKVGYTVKSDEIYFELKNISAPNLDTPYTLHIGNNNYNYAVLDYVRNYLTNGTNDDTKALAATMYYYNQKANVFFGD